IDRRTHVAYVRRHHPAAAPLARPQPRRLLRSAARRGRRGPREVRGLMLRAIASSPLNLLLIVAPISWALAAQSPESPWVFLTAAASLIPLAGLIGLGTEQLARRPGPALGGFLNATFGNAAELIIAVVALRGGHVALVKASISGSIVGNLLLVLGLSFFVGGLGRRSQKF